MQESRRLQNDGGTENAGRAHDKGAQTGEDTIRGTQVGCTFATAIEDQQLMPDQYGFGNHGTEPARNCQPDHGNDHMNEEDDDIAHPGMLSKPQKPKLSAQFNNSPWTPQAVANLAQRIGVGELAEQHRDQLRPAAKTFGAPFRIVFFDQRSELGPGKMLEQLIEQTRDLYDGFAFLVGAVWRSSGQGTIRQRSL